MNLLSNAVKFTHDGSIQVGVQTVPIADLSSDAIPLNIRDRGGIWLLVHVRDTGIGITPENMKIIFDAFRQADGSSVREYEGTGLGLTITERLIKMHHGHIWVDSKPGEGSTFYIVLPTQLAPRHTQTLPTVDDQRPLVLVADDDATTLQLVEDYIDSDLYQVVTTTDSLRLVKLAQNLNPAIIITDIMMPNMDGLQVLKELKSLERTRDIPVIILSILDKEREGRDAGAAAYLTKPVTRHELIATLSAVYSPRTEP